MSTVADLEAKAAKAQAAAQAAREAAEQAAQGIAERNADRTRAFWQQQASKADGYHRRLSDARKAITAAVLAGDGPAILSRYLEYVKAHAEADQFLRAASTALTDKENVGRLDERQVTSVAQLYGHPLTFDQVLAADAAELHRQHGAAHLQSVLGPLHDSLESE